MIEIFRVNDAATSYLRDHLCGSLSLGFLAALSYGGCKSNGTMYQLIQEGISWLLFEKYLNFLMKTICNLFGECADYITLKRIFFVQCGVEAKSAEFPSVPLKSR